MKLKTLFLGVILIFSCSTLKEKSFIYNKLTFKESDNILIPFQLTFDISEDFYPSVSLNGRYIVYVSDRSGNLDLWIYDIEKRESFRVTYHTSDDTMPYFSPDGKKIVFVSYRSDSAGDIWYFDFKDIKDRLKSNLEEDEVKELLKDDYAKPLVISPYAESEPKFTSDNKSILFVREDRKGIKNIFLKKAKLKSKEKQLTYSGASSPAISLNNKFMAYIDISTNKYKRGHLFLLNLENSKVTQLTYGESLEFTPNFIGNDKIVYSSIKIDYNKNGKIDLNDTSVICIYNLNSGKEEQLTPENQFDFYPVFNSFWGSNIIYSGKLFNNFDLFIIPIYGTIPELNNQEKQFLLAEKINNKYSKILAYKKFITDYPESEKLNYAKLKIGEIYSELNLNREAYKYLNDVINNTELESEIRVEAEIKKILISEESDKKKLENLKKLKSRISQSKLFILNFYMAEILLNLKEYSEAINYYRNVINDTFTDSEFYAKSRDRLIQIYDILSLNKDLLEQLKDLSSFTNFFERINFIEKIHNTYFQKIPEIRFDSEYSFIISLLPSDSEARNYFKIKYSEFCIKNNNFKKAEELLNSVIQNTQINNYFKFLALKNFSNIDEKKRKYYLQEALKIDLPENFDFLKEGIRKELLSILLKEAQDLISLKNYLKARDVYKFILDKIENKNIAATAGLIRCDFELIPHSIENYKKIIERYKKIAEQDKYSAFNHYILGYTYSLTYSYLYNEKERKIKNLKKYFKLAEEELKVAYRLNPFMIESYLTLGWLYQVHYTLDKKNYKSLLNEAITLYKLALQYNDEDKNPYNESMLYLNLGNIYFELKNYSTAMECYGNKLKYSKEFQTSFQESFFYYNYGYACFVGEEDELALQNFEKAYTNFIKCNEKEFALDSLIFNGIIYKIKREYKKAIIQYEKGIEFINNNKLNVNPERLYREIGLCYKELNQIDKALEYFFKSLKIIPKDKKLSFWKRPAIKVNIIDLISIPVFPVNISLGASFAYMGFNNRDEQKLLYSLISDTYFNNLNYSKALNFLLEKKLLLEEDKNYDALAPLYNKMGLIYFNLNEIENAIKYFELSKKYCKKIKDYYGAAINNLNIIEILMNKNELVDNFKEINKLLEETLSIAKEIKNNSIIIDVYNLLGLLYFNLAEKNNKNLQIDENSIDKSLNILKDNILPYYKALNYFNSALSVALKENYKIKAVKLYFNIALLYYNTHDYDKALELFKTTYSEAKKFLLSELEYKSKFFIDKIENSISDPIIIKKLESLPKGYEYKIKSDPITEMIYLDFIKNYINQKDYLNALLFIEKYKNYKIKQVFNSYPISIKSNDIESYYEFKNKEQEIINSESEFLKTKFQKNEKFITKIEELYNQVTNLAERIDPNLKYYIYKADIPIYEIQNLIEEDEIIARFFLDNNTINLFLIKRDSINFYSTNIAFAEIENLINDFYKSILKKREDYFYYSKKLYDILFSKCKNEIENHKKIVIIPDNMLFKIPFNLILREKNIFNEITLFHYYTHKMKFRENYLKFSIIDKKSKELPLSDFVLCKTELDFSKLNSIKFNISDSIDISQITGRKNFPYFFAFENIQNNLDEDKIIKIVIPLDYAGAKNVSLNFWQLPEKLNNEFWNNFLNLTQRSFSERYFETKKIIKNYYQHPYYYESRIIFGPDFNIKTEYSNITKLTDYLKLGNLNFESNNFNKAFEYYVKAYSSLSNNKEFIIERIVYCLTNLNQNLDALKWCEYGVKFNSDKFNRLSAIINFKSKNYDETLKFINAVSNQTKKDSEVKIISIINSKIPSDEKRVLLNNEIIKYLKLTNNRPVLNQVIEFLIKTESLSNIYKIINFYKEKNNIMSLSNIQKILNTDEILIDFYISDENILLFNITKTDFSLKTLKSSKFYKLLKNFGKSINDFNEEDFNSVLKDIYEFFFKNLDLDKFTRIIFFPDGDLYKIPFYALTDGKINLIDKKIKIIKSYSSIKDYKIYPKTIFAIGYKLDSGSKLIEDFSYKELEEIKYNFDNADIVINPFEDIKRDYNKIDVYHLSLGVYFTNGVINFSDFYNNKIEAPFLSLNKELIFLSKFELLKQEIEIENLFKLNSVELIINLYRNSDLYSALFVKIFYKNLKNNMSVPEAFYKAINDLRIKVSSSPALASCSFILIE